MKKIISKDDVLDGLEEVQEYLFEIPLGNSQFQTEKFIIASSITPERAYRAILLNIQQALESVYSGYDELEKAEKKYSKEEKEVEEKIKNEKDEHEIKRLNDYMRRERINIKKIKGTIDDDLHNVNVMYHHLQKLPKYTREQFEYGEGRYYLESLKRQAMGLDGPKNSLLAMFDDIKALENFEKKYAELPKDQQHLLQKITEESLTNLSDNPVLSRQTNKSIEEK